MQNCYMEGCQVKLALRAGQILVFSMFIIGRFTQLLN